MSRKNFQALVVLTALVMALTSGEHAYVASAMVVAALGEPKETR